MLIFIRNYMCRDLNLPTYSLQTTELHNSTDRQLLSIKTINTIIICKNIFLPLALLDLISNYMCSWSFS